MNFCTGASLRIILFAFSLLSVGCAMQPKQEAMIPVGKVTTFESNKVFGGRIAYKPLRNPATKFDYAVTSALRNQGWLNVSGNPAYYLSPTILSESLPKSGFSMTGTLSVSYTLTSSSGSALWSKRVDTSIKKDLTDKFSGVARAESIVEDYVRLNISDMMESLDYKGRLIYAQIEESANQRMITIKRQFVDSDLFSGNSFFDTCSDPICSSYSRKSTIVSETSVDWLAKINSQPSFKVQRFYTTYNEYLTLNQKSQILEKIQAKQKSEAQQRERAKDRHELPRETVQEGKGVAF